MLQCSEGTKNWVSYSHRKAISAPERAWEGAHVLFTAPVIVKDLGFRARTYVLLYLGSWSFRSSYIVLWVTGVLVTTRYDSAILRNAFFSRKQGTSVRKVDTFGVCSDHNPDNGIADEERKRRLGVELDLEREGGCPVEIG